MLTGRCLAANAVDLKLHHLTVPVAKNLDWDWNPGRCVGRDPAECRQIIYFSAIDFQNNVLLPDSGDRRCTAAGYAQNDHAMSCVEPEVRGRIRRQRLAEKTDGAG